LGNLTLMLQDGATVSEKSIGGERARDIAELFDREYKSLHRLAYVFVADAAVAEEIVMEAFVKIFSGWNRFRSIDHKSAYLKQMVVNGCRSRLRRRGIERRVNEFAHRNLARPQGLESDHSDMQMDLWNAVRRLPDRQRAAVVLRYLEDLPEAEIADVLDCSVGTVKSQLSRARRKLEVLLTEETILDE
jgi:RNA polymerase sigma-70 factor (sigma-E family)